MFGQIKKFPVVKTMKSYMILTAGADVIEQLVITKRHLKDYKYSKTMRISCAGGFVIGPLIYNWIKFIEKRIPTRSVPCTVIKVILDSTVFAPVAISLFYISTNVLEFKTDIFTEWKQKFYKTWTAGLMYWPVVQGINFAFVPMRYKTSIYLPICSFIWSNYLCYMKEKMVWDK